MVHRLAPLPLGLAMWVRNLDNSNFIPTCKPKTLSEIDSENLATNTTILYARYPFLTPIFNYFVVQHHFETLTNLFLVGMSLICDAFTRNQLPDVSAQREESWGQHVVNREAFSQWRALGCRLGMTPDRAANVAVLRQWMETQGPVKSVAHHERTGPGPSRIRRHNEMSGETRDDDRSNWVRGRYDRSRSRDRSGRGSSLNRGTSGRSLHRTRDDN